LSYAFLIVLNVVTLVASIVFDKTNIIREDYLPAIFNPFFCMVAMIVHRSKFWEDSWLVSIIFFILLVVISVVFAVRNIRRIIV
jgi:hypothetical protein